MEKEKFCVVKTGKLKSPGAMREYAAHVYRTKPCPSANPEEAYKNEELVALPSHDFAQAFDERVKAKNIHYRKDAIREIDVILYGHKKMNDEELTQWKQKSKEWLQDYFGKDRVIAVVYHGDEGKEGAHIHAVIIPEFDGHLRGGTFLDGADKLSDMQTSYAEAVKDLGLERGVKNGGVHYETLQRLNGLTEREVKKTLPAVREGETAMDYFERANEVYIDANLHHFVETNDLKNAATKKVNLAKKAAEEAAQERDAAQEKVASLEAEAQSKDKKIEALEAQNKELLAMLKKEGFSQADIKNLTSIKKVLWSVQHGVKDPQGIMDALQRGVDFFNKNDRSRGEQMRIDTQPVELIR